MIDFVYDDGGREAAGFKGHAGDCVVRALTIANDEDYRVVYDELMLANRAALPKGSRSTASPRDSGTSRKVYDAWLARRGWTWTPTMKIGQGCTVHLRADDRRTITRPRGNSSMVFCTTRTTVRAKVCGVSMDIGRDRRQSDHTL